ncbi:hypothetical protein AMTRI_Chr10g228530 [Amborella trichopoda]
MGRISSVRLLFLAYCRLLVGNGSKTQFWHAKCPGDNPLKSQYPNLVLKCIPKNLLISDGLERQGENITWNLMLSSRRVGSEVEQRYIQLMDDKVIWEMEPSGVFTVKSLYNILWLDKFIPANNFSRKVWSYKPLSG